jgi:hypothetical protein
MSAPFVIGALRQLATTSTVTVAVTSGWISTLAVCLPTVLIGEPSSTLRLSRTGPPAAFTASATSAEVADLAHLASALDLSDLLLAATGPVDGETAGEEVVTAVAVLDLDHVAGGAQSGDVLGEDELHGMSFFRAAVQRAVDV